MDAQDNGQKKLDHGSIPRPVNMINQNSVRYQQPERFGSIPGNLNPSPSAGMPFFQVDEGQSGPRFVRATSIYAPSE